MKALCCLFLLLLASTAYSQSANGIFDADTDIGSPKQTGTSQYHAADQTYTLKGGGYNIWFGRDEFNFLYKTLKGDFILTANVAFEGAGTDPHRKIGWMIRESKDDNSPHISGTLHGDGLISLQWREIKGAFMRDPQDEIKSIKKYTSTLQLERKGKEVILRIANAGEPLQIVGKHTMDNLPDEVLAGLFICAHNDNVTETGKAWNVRIDQPVPDKYNPDTSGYVGSRLETLDITTGIRKVVHESNGRFEAPNWMPDGKSLLFNEGGSLYTIPVQGGTPQKLNTGDANRNNNDHGISFDGKMLAISNHRQGLPGGGSSVYVLPLQGGTPKLITEQTPSYFHGWSHDGKYVLYVAQRGTPIYDVYKAPIAGGKEIKLTQTPPGAHVDGPEASRDGKYIYYNASNTGTMQLWRMKPDGSNKEQVTFDDYNNWFPHLSPDGKWIAFISFPSDINANDHPAYKRVMLRLMPTTGGIAPKVIAFLYGGQGTINVTSWSPDSRSLAFVSNSGKP